MNPDQARQNVGPDQDPKCLKHWWYKCGIPERVFEIVDFEKKNQQRQKNMKNFPTCKELKKSIVALLVHFSELQKPNLDYNLIPN